MKCNFHVSVSGSVFSGFYMEIDVYINKDYDIDVIHSMIMSECLNKMKIFALQNNLFVLQDSLKTTTYHIHSHETYESIVNASKNKKEVIWMCQCNLDQRFKPKEVVQTVQRYISNSKSES